MLYVVFLNFSIFCCWLLVEGYMEWRRRETVSWGPWEDRQQMGWNCEANPWKNRKRGEKPLECHQKKAEFKEKDKKGNSPTRKNTAIHIARLHYKKEQKRFPHQPYHPKKPTPFSYISKTIHIYIYFWFFNNGHSYNRKPYLHWE